ncbi:MAG TPA: HNH nuclease family protein [Desulfobacteraceae bacterium]|nr:HNH nuclease family protein [Desulfobacteraceae bacterium]
MSREEVEKIVEKARGFEEDRMKGYREKSLKLHPWVCARCGREFTASNLHLLTVHHKDHNHDNNPPDGSNWENLCIYCHENEHRRYLDHEEAVKHVESTGSEIKGASATYKPFTALRDLLKSEKK